VNVLTQEQAQPPCFRSTLSRVTSALSTRLRELVKHKFAEDRYIPYNDVIILVRFSEDLTGPGPSVTDLPSRAPQFPPRDYTIIQHSH
jgi:hypothetical protein